jgi:hypothetical protein
MDDATRTLVGHHRLVTSGITTTFRVSEMASGQRKLAITSILPDAHKSSAPRGVASRPEYTSSGLTEERDQDRQIPDIHGEQNGSAGG